MSACRPWLLAIILVACGSPGDGADGRAPRAQAVPARAADHAWAWRLGPPIVFVGACDASGAAGLPGGRVVVADDEDNRLRFYDAAAGGAPIEVVDTAPYLAEAGRKDPEMDLEAAATDGDRTYWIASHGRKKSGKRAPSRLRLFATEVAGRGDGTGLRVVGRVYRTLLEDLIAAPSLSRHDLAAAADRSPAEAGGLNIEGLTDSVDSDHLLIGLRSPVPGGRALLVPLENAAAMIERGAPARVGSPIELDLGGRGVRSISSWEGAYWIVGGAPTGRAESRLYRWAGSGQPVWIRSVRFGDLNPEGMAEVTIGSRRGLMVLSDDGERDMGEGVACKKLKDPERKQFRAVLLERIR